MAADVKNTHDSSSVKSISVEDLLPSVDTMRPGVLGELLTSSITDSASCAIVQALLSPQPKSTTSGRITETPS